MKPEDITIFNIYVPNIEAPVINQILAQREKLTITQ